MDENKVNVDEAVNLVNRALLRMEYVNTDDVPMFIPFKNKIVADLQDLLKRIPVLAGVRPLDQKAPLLQGRPGKPPSKTTEYRWSEVEWRLYLHLHNATSIVAPECVDGDWKYTSGTDYIDRSGHQCRRKGQPFDTSAEAVRDVEFFLNGLEKEKSPVPAKPEVPKEPEVLCRWELDDDEIHRYRFDGGHAAIGVLKASTRPIYLVRLIVYDTAHRGKVEKVMECANLGDAKLHGERLVRRYMGRIQKAAILKQMEQTGKS